MKKIIIFGVVLAMVILFTLPTMIFADTGDDSMALGSEPDGQYIMDPLNTDYADPPESVPGPENERMEVYCIDEDVTLDPTGFDYEETGINVSDELIANGEDPDVAEAVEIMATTATGASNEVNQDVVWDLLTSLTGDENPVSLDTTGQAVRADVLALAEEYNTLYFAVNNDTDDTNDVSLQKFLDDKGINDLDVYLGDPLGDPVGADPFINEATGETNNEFTATAIMASPLVPGVTDGGADASISSAEVNGSEPVAAISKTVFWYILEGSYNVSFSQTDLVTETTSLMFDYTDDGNDVDKDLDTTDDNYGKAEVPYFFYWWGVGFPEYEVMNVNISASVDIDEDGQIDKEQGPDLAEFTSDTNVVKVGDTGEVIKTGEMLDANGNPDDGDPNTPFVGTIPAVETFVPENIDVDYYNAGKIVVAEGRRNILDCEESVYEDVWIPTYWEIETEHPEQIIHHDGYRFWFFGWHYVPAWDEVIPAYNTYSGLVLGHYVNGAAGVSVPEGYYGLGSCKEYQDGSNVINPAPYYQRFAIESYSEPTAAKSQLYTRWLDYTVNKTQEGSSQTIPVAGATYKLTYNGGRTDPNSYPYETEFTAITDINGQASFTDLPWGFYTLTEEEPVPAGYLLDTVPKSVGIGGDIFFEDNKTDLPNPYGYIDVTNALDPGPEPETITTTTTGAVSVAALTSGISVLAFTGIDPIIPISGAGALISGLGILIASLKTRKNRTK